jgi:periplasmic copper chaperone A
MRPHLPRLLIPVLLAVVLAACGSGAGSSAGAMSISGPWARPAAAGGLSAAYFTMTNNAGTADALLAASSPVAATVEVHETSIDGSGVVAMHPVPRVDVPAGESVVLKPGSYHVMLMGLTGDLTVGKTIELDLVFEHAGKVVVQAEIRQG